jgi:hypothetical protein
MIEPGTLLIHNGTKLPDSVRLKGDPATNGWNTVTTGADLLQLKTDLAKAGWNYFYMGAVKHTVFGSGAKGVALAVRGVTAKTRLNRCNSFQIDGITAHSWLGIPYLSVSAHCCHIQKGICVTGEKS